MTAALVTWLGPVFSIQEVTCARHGHTSREAQLVPLNGNGASEGPTPRYACSKVTALGATPVGGEGRAQAHPRPPPSLDNTPLPISYNHYRSRQPSVCFVGAEEAQPAGIASTREQPPGQTHLLCPSGGSRRAHSVVSNIHECSPPQFAFWDRGGSACCSCPGPWSQYWGLGTIGSG